MMHLLDLAETQRSLVTSGPSTENDNRLIETQFAHWPPQVTFSDEVNELLYEIDSEKELDARNILTTTFNTE